MAEDWAVPFRSRDVAELKEKLEMLIRRPDVVHDYEARARNHILQHYWDNVAENTESVYRGLRDGKPA